MNLQQFTFRPATLDDEPALLHIDIRASEDVDRRTGRVDPKTPEMTSQAIDAIWARLANFIRFLHENGVTWLAEANGAPVAYARVAAWGHARQLTEAMVLPGYQDQGLGAALLERTFGSRALQTGELRVIRANATLQAVGLYSRFGVSPVAMEYSYTVDPDAVAPVALALAQSSDLKLQPLDQDHLDAVAEIDRAVLGFDRRILHEFWLRDGRQALALMRGNRLEGYCYYSPGFGPATCRQAADLPATVAVGLLERLKGGTRPIRIAGQSGTPHLWRALQPAGPRITGLVALMASDTLPGLDRYVLSDPDYTL